MKKKMPTVIKDGLTGFGMGTAIIVPGISAGTIALVLGSLKKITGAVTNLFSKDFWKNLLILLPYGIGMVIAVAALYFPFDYALNNCMLAIVSLFAGCIIGCFPGVVAEVKGEKPTKTNIILLIAGLLLTTAIGVLSIFLKSSSVIENWFNDIPFYLYLIIIVVGVISSAGIIVPGFSGSLILLVINFYKPIFGLFHFVHGGKDVLLILCYVVGIILGFLLWSRIVNKTLTNHKQSTMYFVIGLIIGSLISIFCNDKMIGYIQESAGKLDFILTPILAIVGVTLGILFRVLTKNHKGEENA